MIEMCTFSKAESELDELVECPNPRHALHLTELSRESDALKLQPFDKTFTKNVNENQ